MRERYIHGLSSANSQVCPRSVEGMIRVHQDVRCLHDGISKYAGKDHFSKLNRFCASLTELHRTSASPTEKSGFGAPTCCHGRFTRFIT